MAGIFIFSEDRALAAQLLTPALELKAALGEPLIALARDAAQATELSTLGPDKVLVVGDSCLLYTSGPGIRGKVNTT